MLRHRVVILVILGVCLSGNLRSQDRKDAIPGLKEIQDEISKTDKDGYYKKEYRRSEDRWWLKVPSWMRTHAQTHKVKRILDIGCGYGTLLTLASQIYQADGYCMDVSRYLDPSFAAAHNLQFQQGNIELDPIPWSEPFDVIIFTEVLEHFNFQPVPTLKKMHDALSPDGVLYLTTPDQAEWGMVEKYYKHLKDLPLPRKDKKIVDDHIWIFSKKELLQALSEAGFAVEKLEYAPGVNFRHFNLIVKRKE